MTLTQDQTQTEVTQGLPLPPHTPAVIGGPSEKMEATPVKTMTEQLAEIQGKKGRSQAKETTQETQTLPTETHQEPETPQAPEYIYVGSKRYTPQEIAELEARAQRPVETPTETNTSRGDQKTQEDYGDLMFSDPNKFAQTLIQKSKAEAKAEILAEEQKKKSEQEVQRTFYDKNKDLRGNEDLVEYYALKMRGELAKEPPEVALSKLAQAVRARVAKIKGSVELTEHLPSRPAVTAGATGNPSAPVSQPKGSQKEDFISQMKQAFRKGKVRY